MTRDLKFRILLILGISALAIYYLFPSLRLYRMSLSERQALQRSEPVRYQGLRDRALKLGLDLQGGMHLVLELDHSKAKIPPEEARDAVDRALEIIRNRVDQFGVAEPVIQKVGEERIIVELPGIEDEERAKALVRQTAFLEFKIVRQPAELNRTATKLDSLLSADGGSPAQGQPGETPEGASLPLTAGQDTAVAETAPPAHPFSERLLSLGGDVVVARDDVPAVQRDMEDAGIRAALPPDAEFAWGDPLYSSDGREYRRLFLVTRTAGMTGEYIADARATIGGGYDPSVANQPIVNIQMTREGGRIFERVTGQHVQERLAIILDGVVKSAPVIRQRIPGGSAVIEGIDSIEEARDLAIVLRAGALPAPLEIIEERTVGPSLGADSIRQGSLAGGIALVVVILFMIAYYRLSGLIANGAMLLNTILILAALAALHATLTMPGIAGLILTVGMAVDANVLIYERIREELETGKTVRAAVDAGFERAWRTILDANVTTLITAVILLQFGTGPVKGFAVTLSIGLLANMFTAVFVTRTVFHAWTGQRRLATLSI